MPDRFAAAKLVDHQRGGGPGALATRDASGGGAAGGAAAGAAAGGAAGGAVAGAAAGGAAAAGSSAWAAAGYAAANAGFSSLASTAAVSTINNKGDLGAALKETFSSDSLKGAVTAALTAGITAGVISPNLSGAQTTSKLTAGFDLSTLEGIGGFALHAGAQGVASAGVNTAINGGSFGDNLKGALVGQASNVVAAAAFNYVGGYAHEQWQAATDAGDSAGAALWKEGGAARTALHAMMGGAIVQASGGDFATGAIAAGASQAMAGTLNEAFDSQPELRQAFSQIVGLAAASLAGGDAYKAAWISQAADQYNRQLHQKEALALDALRKQNPENTERLNAAACALVHCSASVPVNDPYYEDLKKLELAGVGYLAEQESLKATGAFEEYDNWDAANDSLGINDEAILRVGSGGRAIAGLLGAAAGYTGMVVSSPACISILGCALPAASGAAASLSLADSWNSTQAAFAPYQSQEGSNVLASFYPETYPGESNRLMGYGISAATVATELALLKGAGKVVSGEWRIGGSAKGTDSASNVALFERQRAGYAAQEIRNAQPVGSALKDDPLHRAPSYVIDQIPEKGRLFTIRGGDGKSYNLTQMEGAVDGKSGIFEWLVNSKGELTHQRFIPGGRITGTPNQVPSRLPR